MQDRFNELSEAVNSYLKTGVYDAAYPLWMKMSEVLHNEGKYADELKILMLAFDSCLTKSGTIYIPAVELAKIAVKNSKLPKEKRRELYFETAADWPGKLSGIAYDEKFYVFECCINGRMFDAYGIIERMIHHKYGKNSYEITGF